MNYVNVSRTGGFATIIFFLGDFTWENDGFFTMGSKGAPSVMGLGTTQMGGVLILDIEQN